MSAPGAGTDAGVESVIRTAGLTKRFGAITAVDAVDLDVRAGDVYGFLGANGSGKTTTVRMLLGLVLATSGTAQVLGRPMPSAAADVLPEVGAMVEGPAAYPLMSGRENLALFDAMGRGSGRRSARRGRAARVGEALERVGLGGVDDRPVRAYSLGMRQRLGLASALMRQPRLLVLDEPTNGLDPQGIHEIRELLLSLNAAGTTVFVSSHLLSEIERTCTRIGVLDRGRLVLQDDLAALGGPTGRVVVGTPELGAASRLLGDAVVERRDDALVVGRPGGGPVDAAEINARLVAGGVPVSGLADEVRSLEEVVLAATSGAGDRHASTTRAHEAVTR